ncbi:MAG: hypothetical protein QXL94_09135 [Candidatus Parvarchaeum sp.]
MEFIAKGNKIKDNIFIDTVAFKAGEPQSYKQLVNILKVKNFFRKVTKTL